MAGAYFKTMSNRGDGLVPEDQKVLASYCQALLSTAEFRNAD